jgi:hypothetical protein
VGVITGSLTPDDPDASLVPLPQFIVDGLGNVNDARLNPTVWIAEFSSYINSASEKTIDGVELDFSLPLTVIGLPGLSFLSNLTYLEVEATNLETGFSARDYNHSYNVTLDYQYNTWGFGISYNEVSESNSFFIDREFIEEDRNLRDPAVEIFVKKDFDNFSITFVAENVLDAKEQRPRDYTSVLRVGDEFQIGDVYQSRYSRTESEPQYILSVRGNF